MPESPQHELPFRFPLSEIALEIAFRKLDTQYKILTYSTSPHAKVDLQRQLSKSDEKQRQSFLKVIIPGATSESLVEEVSMFFDAHPHAKHKTTLARLIALEDPSLQNCDFSENQLRFLLVKACQADNASIALQIKEAQMREEFGIPSFFDWNIVHNLREEFAENKADIQKLRERIQPTPPQTRK